MEWATREREEKRAVPKAGIPGTLSSQQIPQGNRGNATWLCRCSARQHQLLGARENVLTSFKIRRNK